jgi:hypothetical protein
MTIDRYDFGRPVGILTALIQGLTFEDFLFHQQIVMSSDGIVSVSFQTLLNVSIIDAILHPHFIEEPQVHDGLINTDLEAFRDFLRWTIDVEPFMLFNLFYSEAQVWIRYQDVKDQVLHFA